MAHNSTSPTSSAADVAAAAKAKKAIKAMQELFNQNSAKYFGGSIAGVIVIFTLFHWARFLYSRYATKSFKESKFIKTQVSISRSVIEYLELESILTFHIG